MAETHEGKLEHHEMQQLNEQELNQVSGGGYFKPGSQPFDGFYDGCTEPSIRSGTCELV